MSQAFFINISAAHWTPEFEDGPGDNIVGIIAGPSMVSTNQKDPHSCKNRGG
jgi:hypothetical protein